MTSEWAALSVGVVEGQPGWNTLIVRTRRGRQLVEEARTSGWLVTEALSKENLTGLTLAAGNKKKRAWARAREEGLINTDSAKGKRAAIRVNERVFS